MAQPFEGDAVQQQGSGFGPLPPGGRIDIGQNDPAAYQPRWDQTASEAIAKADRERQVPEQVVRLCKVRSRLAAVVDALEERLTPVLRGAGPQLAHESNPEDSRGVPLADRLAGESVMLEVLDAKLVSILDRLEV